MNNFSENTLTVVDIHSTKIQKSHLNLHLKK
ncbi:MAG: hypothetical protein ACJA0Q_001125, partial [Saprospiraceae bacterium]